MIRERAEQWERMTLDGRLLAESVARFDDVTKHHGRVRALDGLTLDVRAGEVFGLLGPNGAGKTTALRARCSGSSGRPAAA